MAAALVAVLCPIASVYAQNDTDTVLSELAKCDSMESPFDRAMCNTDIVMDARDALPLDSITGAPERYDLPHLDFWIFVPKIAIGTIEIEIDGYKTKYVPGEGTYRIGNSTTGWTGNIRDGDGDTISYDGIGRSVFHVKCLEGQNYAVNFHKTEDIGELSIDVKQFDEESNEVLRIDEGSTEAAFGGVLLSGTCHY